MVDYSLHPICDTNILIDLNLGSVFKDFLKKKNKIYVADKVQDEMNNLFMKSTDYQHMLEVFKEERVEILKESLFSEDDKRVMITNLAFYKIQNFIGNRAFGKDAGEFASAFYAVNLGIERLYTNDKNFIHNYGQEPIFENLTMIDLNSALSEILSDTRRISINSKIEAENKKMKRIIKEERAKASENNEDERMNFLLGKLAEKFSS